MNVRNQKPGKLLGQKKFIHGMTAMCMHDRFTPTRALPHHGGGKSWHQGGQTDATFFASSRLCARLLIGISRQDAKPPRNAGGFGVTRSPWQL